MSDYEPPLAVEGSPSTLLDQLAPGVLGYALEGNGKIYIPVILAEKEGSGDVGRFLDSLSPRCVIPNVTSDRLRGMLLRRKFVRTDEIDPRAGLVDVYVRGIAI